MDAELELVGEHVIGLRKRTHDVHGVLGLRPDVELAVPGQQKFSLSSSAGKMSVTCSTAVRCSPTGLTTLVFMSSRSFRNDSVVVFTPGFAADSQNQVVEIV